jgi:xanthine dehydrogenase small subunit
MSERFSRPGTVDECVALRGKYPDAKVVAGGTDLAVESNLRFRTWPHLISVESVAELKEFSETADRITIGAGLTLNEIGRRWATPPAAFVEWLSLFASPLIRNRATLGGNLATASPIGDAAPLLMAVDASVNVAGPGGRRNVPLSSFFESYRKTAMKPQEVLVNVEIPKPLPRQLAFYKISKRKLDDISTVAAAMAIDADSSGRLQRVRFAYGGVAATPVRVAEAEYSVIGQPWNEASVMRAQKIIGRALMPLGDHRGSREYRLEVSKSLVEKFWWEHRQ